MRILILIKHNYKIINFIYKYEEKQSKILFLRLYHKLNTKKVNYN